ncbi:c-type cytochrome [Variovorax sp. KK3]|uniref:c-type cytochrome n=1 Tax=Variovorax sp. KK3 TaxID=1855728 RepID=UPI0015C3646E|nr:c-type cytochrome [Variovorax sp. KK3]
MFWLCAPAGAQQAGKASKGTKGAEAPAAAPGAAYAQRFAQLCAACHGANGRSEMPNTPALSGQHSFYAITQLFLFREGRRSNEAMSAIAKGMKDEDLRGFSDFIATLPAVPPPPATPPDAARMTRGKALALEHKCVFCHGADFSGGQQVPRIGGQREDYLKMTLQEFKSAKRVGYTMAMAEAVGRIPGEDLDTLAYYLARFPGTPSPAGPASPASPAPTK